jgi:hypothetical protein
MTSFSSTLGEESPLPLPISEEPPATSVWPEIPVLEQERRVRFRPRDRADFVATFHELQFLTSHPEIRPRPREPVLKAMEEEEAIEEPVPELFPGKDFQRTNPRSIIATKLAARAQYTKEEIRAMLGSMEEQLAVVEQDLSVTDEAGQRAIEVALDEKNFANLHKQYEEIRAELVNTLSS